jgi:uncharacterized membrane protein YraQ (UPF0718 family)
VFGLYAVTGILMLISLATSREKTLSALKHAWRSGITVLPVFLMMIIFVSIVLGLLPESVIVNYLGNGGQGIMGILSGLLLGSVTVMPGFIAFPLCGILLKQGVAYMVLSAFSTSLMMVGVLTYPLEKQYFGARVTILRNAIGLMIAFLVAIMTGLFFGELF